MLLGLRVDAVSARARRFVAPWTLVFAREGEGEGEDGATALRLVRHSVPAGAVALRAALRRWMPGAVKARPTAAGDDGEEESGEGSGEMVPGRRKQDVGAFAREIRRAMVGMVRREDAVTDMKQQCEGRRGVEASVGPNGCREVEITVDGVAVVRLAMADSGLVEKAVVRDLESGSGPRRRKSIEKAILAREGRAEGLIERMMRAVQATSRLE
jgi:hypothetical protein